MIKPDVIAVRIRKREDDVERELEENDRENEEQGRREEQGGGEEAIRCRGAIHFRKSAAEVTPGHLHPKSPERYPQNEVVRRHWAYLQASRIPAQLTLWLLVVGVNAQRWKERACAAEAGLHA